MAASACMLVLAILGYAGTVLATNHAQINEELNGILQNLDAADHNRNYRKNALINHQYLRTDDENDLKSHFSLRADDVNDEEISTEEHDDELAGRFPFVPNDCHAWLPISQIVPCPSGFGQCITVCTNGCRGQPVIWDSPFPPNNPGFPGIKIPGGNNNPQIAIGKNRISVGCMGRRGGCQNDDLNPDFNRFPSGPIIGGCLGGNSCQGGANAFQSQAQTQVRGIGAQSQNQGQALQAGRGATQTQARMRAALLRNQARTHFGRTVFNPKTVPPRSNIRLKIYA